MTNIDIQAYDVASFCRAYGISRSFAYLEIKARRLQIFKAGRRTLIAKDSADAWRRACEAATRAAHEAARGRGAGESR